MKILYSTGIALLAPRGASGSVPARFAATVSGIVVGEPDGQPIPGVSVVEIGRSDQAKPRLLST